MQAIRTRKLPATATRDDRIVAETSSGIRRVFPYQHDMDAEPNHLEAAVTLAESLGWAGKLHGGTFRDDYYWTLEHVS